MSEPKMEVMTIASSAGISYRLYLDTDPPLDIAHIPMEWSDRIDPRELCAAWNNRPGARALASAPAESGRSRMLPGSFARMIDAMISRVLAGESPQSVVNDYGPWEWDLPPVMLAEVARLRAGHPDERRDG